MAEIVDPLHDGAKAHVSASGGKRTAENGTQPGRRSSRTRLDGAERSGGLVGRLDRNLMGGIAHEYFSFRFFTDLKSAIASASFSSAATLADSIGRHQSRSASERFGIFIWSGSFTQSRTTHKSAAKISERASGSHRPATDSPSARNASAAVPPCFAFFSRAAR